MRIHRIWQGIIFGAVALMVCFDEVKAVMRTTTKTFRPPSSEQGDIRLDRNTCVNIPDGFIKNWDETCWDFP